MRVKWATTCERFEVDGRGAHSLTGVGVSILPVTPAAKRAELPVFVSLSLPRHELDMDREVAIVVTDPAQRSVAEVGHTIRIPGAALPTGPMDGYEVPAYLSAIVEFELTSEGAYSVYVTSPSGPGGEPPEPLTVFVERTG